MFAHQHIKQQPLSCECTAASTHVGLLRDGPHQVLDQAGTKWMVPQAVALLLIITEPYGQQRQSRACIGFIAGHCKYGSHSRMDLIID